MQQGTLVTVRDRQGKKAEIFILGSPAFKLIPQPQSIIVSKKEKESPCIKSSLLGQDGSVIRNQILWSPNLLQDSVFCTEKEDTGAQELSLGRHFFAIYRPAVLREFFSRLRSNTTSPA